REPWSVLGISRVHARAYGNEMKSETAIIALGANLHSRAGSPERTIRAALVELERAGLVFERVSKLYGSPAWPDPNEPRFVNAVARVRTNLAPIRLLELL